MTATRFVHPMQFTGQYVGGSWAGYRFKEPLGYTTGLHTGCDYNYGAGAADKGKPVVSIANGIVRLVQNLTTKGFGNTVIIEHPLPVVWQKELGTTSLFSRYMHLENLNYAKVGQEVNVGQQIGTCGMTGTTAYHLHIDLWKANLGVHTEYHKNSQLTSYLDPYLFIEAHKKEVDEVITKEDIGPIRIVMSEVEGWDGHGIHAGKYDSQILDAWVGKKWTDMLWHCWNAQKVKRHHLNDKVATLESELTKLKAESTVLKTGNYRVN